MIKVHIYDLDGTISNDAWRKGKLPDYDAYHAFLGYDKIMNLRQIQCSFEAGNDIVICTARPAKFEEATLTWLAKHNIEFALMLMRKDDDKRSAVEVKFDQVKILRDKGYEIDAAFDDREDVCRMYASQGIRAFLLDERETPERVIYELRDISPPHPADVLEKVAATMRERNKAYKDSYIQHGDIMATLFPNGIELVTPEDFAMFGIMNMMVSKLYRFAASDMLHVDSVHDLCAYSAIAEFLLTKDSL